MPGWSTSFSTPRCVAPATMREGAVAGAAAVAGAGAVVSGTLSTDVALVPVINRVTTPTDPGGTTTAGTTVTRFCRGLILYVPGVSTSRCTPFSPGATTSRPCAGSLPSCTVTSPT